MARRLTVGVFGRSYDRGAKDGLVVSRRSSWPFTSSKSSSSSKQIVCEDTLDIYTLRAR